MGLSRDEDDSLRRLAYMDSNGGLSSWSRERVTELRTRDRRASVRQPREDGAPDAEASGTERQTRGFKPWMKGLRRLLRP